MTLFPCSIVALNFLTPKFFAHFHKSPFVHFLLNRGVLERVLKHWTSRVLYGFIYGKCKSKGDGSLLSQGLPNVSRVRYLTPSLPGRVHEGNVTNVE